MKTLRTTIAMLALILGFTMSSLADARVQVIHNSSDPAAEVVDVWLNDILLIDNFKFRTATPFIDAPAGSEFTISIAGPKSTSPAEAIWSQAYTLADNETYVLIANGIVQTNSGDVEKTFNIYVYDMGREQASTTGNTDILVFHGSVNVPAVDVAEIGKGAGQIIDDLNYGNYTGYLELPTDDYILQISDKYSTNGIVNYSAPLATLGLQNAAMVAVASGFLGSNDMQADFGLWVALPTGGDLVELPVFVPGNARVQVIHNAADVAAQTVDVWLNGDKLIDNFMFRTSTPFIDVPTGINLNIAIQGANSTSAENPLWQNNYVLEDNKTYVLIANGIVSQAGYTPAIPFDIYVTDMGRETAGMMNNTDVLVFHGSTDAPTVDVIETGAGAGTVVDDLMYGDFAGYLELPTADYILSIADASGENTLVSYAAPLSTLGLNGAALVTVASGFLNPANNSNGEAFGLWVALPSGGNLVELPVHTSDSDVMETARVQVIHNSADAAAAVVDVWLNDVLLLDDFSFRTASPFVDAPAGQEFTVSIKGPDSTTPNDPIWSQNYTLAAGETYVLVANGIVSATGYDPVKPFDIYVYAMGRETASMMENTDVLVFHGSTDAPTVDVAEIGAGAGTIVDNLMYGDFAGYLELPTADYVLDIMDETGENSVISFSAPLATLGLNGAALVTVASGFLSPEMNNNGAGFGLWVALPSGGELIPLPVYESSSARVQVIHNSADAAAAVVDVWLNDVLLLDDFSFRTASPFVDAPAGEEFTISIKGPDSTTPNDPIWSQNYTLAAGETYVLVANGIVSATGYDPVQPFDIYVYAMGREEASSSNNSDVLVFHGSTDAPTVDVKEIGAGAGTIVDDLMYGDFAGYLELPTADYILDIRDETGQNSVISYSAPLATLGLNGAALVTVASGFLNPANNSNGPGFGLYVALPSGGELVPLPMFEAGTARVQVIHNSADMAAEVVDVWLNDDLLLDNFTFRTASPFVDAPAGVNLRINIKGPDSMNPNDPIWSNNYVLEDGATYVLIANGIVSASGYDPVEPFDIFVYNMGRETASMAENTDVLVFHGSTDAPTVDVVEVGVGAGTIIDNLMYGDYAGYLELGTADYRLAIKDESGQNTVVTYDAPLSTLGLNGTAITVVASGFLNPANNSGGENFGLWVALASGGQLVELPQWLGVTELISESSVNAFPNPATNYFNIQYNLVADADVTIEVHDVLGSKVLQQQLGARSNQMQNHKINVSNLREGLYFVTINAGNSRVTKKIQVVN